MNINIGSYVVRGSDGTVDHEATLHKFAGDLSKYEANRETEAGALAGVIHAIFDENLGKHLGKKWFISEALRRLNATPDNWSTLEKRLETFLKESPEFDSAVGKGGGLYRVKDAPPPKAK